MPTCSGRRAPNWGEVKPGTTLHLYGRTGCREFLVASEKTQDPITGNEGYRVMEIGDTPLMKGAEKPFTGVVLTLFPHAASQWHTPDAS